MATIKSYTDFSQSKTLRKILPLESADMWYDNDGESIAGRPEVRCGYFIGLASKNIPCWSLAALLNVLPSKLQIVLAINEVQEDRKETYVIGSLEHDKYDCFADNPIDACVAMIEHLHGLKIL